VDIPKFIIDAATVSALNKHKPEDGRSYWWNDSSYESIIGLIGEIVLYDDSCEECTGDAFAMVKRDGNYGILSHSYGSCSQCDDMQSCSKAEEVAELANRIAGSVEWFGSLADVKARIGDDSVQMLKHTWHLKHWQSFRSRVLAFSE
jgi:hypothetical protein